MEFNIAAFLKKDIDQFNFIFRKYYPALLGYCNKICHNYEEAEDITQTLFSTIWNSSTIFESEDNLKAYLYKSIRNACYNITKIKRTKDKAKKELMELSEEYNVESYDNQIIHMELMRLIHEELKKLTTKEGKVLKLSFLGKTSTEIAGITKATRKTVLNQRKAASNKLVFLILDRLKKDKIPMEEMGLFKVSIGTISSFSKLKLDEQNYNVAHRKGRNSKNDPLEQKLG